MNTEIVITSSALILVVVALRLIFRKKVTPGFIYALWLIVAMRLLLPFSFGVSSISVLNALPQHSAAVQTEGLYSPVQSNETEQAINAAQSNNTVPSINIAKAHDSARTSLVPDIAEYATSAAPGASVSPDASNVKPMALNTLSAKAILKYVYLSGVVLLAIVFAAGNIGFYVKLRRSRKRIGVSSPLKVYVTQAIPGPCLFGLILPAIYLMPRTLEDDTKVHHILAHELTHFRHFDHIWGFMRMLCIVLFWCNPLVWLAAALSKLDGELCCDASTVKALGEESRLSYVRTLIETAADGRRVDILCATSTLSVGKRGMKSRISMLTNKRKTAVVLLFAALLGMAVAVGCTFTSATDKGLKSEPVQEGKNATGVNPPDNEKSSEAPLDTQPETQLDTKPDTQPNAQHNTKPDTEQEDTLAVSTLELTEAEKNAKPFLPGETHDITSAELMMSFGTYTLEDEVKLDLLERTLAGATILNGGAGCPFSSVLYLTRADGETFYVRHAEDSCQTLEVNGAYYEYDMDEKSSFEFFSLFGVQQHHTKYEYDSAGRVTKETNYSWQTPGDSMEYEYDANGNLIKETYMSGDKSIVRETTKEYDAQGRLIRESTRDNGEDSHEILYAYNANGNLISMMAYHANGNPRTKTLYSYDAFGRLLIKEFYPDGVSFGYREVCDYKSDKEYSVSTYGESKQLSYVNEFTCDHVGNVLKRTHILADGSVESIWEYDYGEQDGMRTITQTMYPGKDGRQEVSYETYESAEITKLSIVPEDYGISAEDLMSIFASDFSQFSIVKLCVYYLNLDGAIAQDAAHALYRRFMRNPLDVLDCIALMGNQETQKGVADYALCEAIATSDVVLYGGRVKFEALVGHSSGIDPSVSNKTYLSLMNSMWQEAKQSSLLNSE
jgi:YD repeat-containing protein